MHNNSGHIQNLSLVGGRLCLDFVNTANWPFALNTTAINTFDTTDEKLISSEDIVRWGQHTRLIDDVAVRVLVGQIQATPRAAAALVPNIHALRLSVRKLCTTSGRISPLDMETLNKSLQQGGIPSLTHDGNHFLFTHGRMDFSWLEAAVAYSTAELLTSPLKSRIKVCPGEGCGMLFLDASPNNRRRWCSMATCGNRHKVKQHYERNKK